MVKRPAHKVIADGVSFFLFVIIDLNLRLRFQFMLCLISAKEIAKDHSLKDSLFIIHLVITILSALVKI